MAHLPESFVDSTRRLMGAERFERYLRSFDESAPVSIRLNPLKSMGLEVVGGEAVPWCRGGYYLSQRPAFTMDPLLHAGCYYVQEAASMFLDEILRQQGPSVNGPLVNGQSLDLCAAPGGKSTLLRTALPAGCVLYSNEPMRQRASILAENVSKWGWPNHIVTNNYPRDYRKAGLRFDVILCDVPCSGEGMFRKDPATIGEWSPQQVEKCWPLQREIVADAWACLDAGGLFIYSTCTFNTKENEENVRYFLDQYGAELVPVAVRPEWNITGSLLQGFDQPVYRFIPGTTRSEGLFMAVLRKRGQRSEARGERNAESGQRSEARGERNAESGQRSAARGKRNAESGQRSAARGKRNAKRQPASALTILSPLQEPRSPLQEPCSPLEEPRSPLQVPLTYPQAISYLRGEALVLPPDTPRGIVAVTFMGRTLGQVKNIGPRANNLYPKPWRIKTTHTPDTYASILQEKT